MHHHAAEELSIGRAAAAPSGVGNRDPIVVVAELSHVRTLRPTRGFASAQSQHSYKMAELFKIQRGDGVLVVLLLVRLELSKSHLQLLV